LSTSVQESGVYLDLELGQGVGLILVLELADLPENLSK
jgi:hypothetical protein